MEQDKRKRELIKTIAIVFLVIMLVLTFFSNTIMNHSLPEVSSQYVQPGSINAKIRGSGTVSANESYEVKINQTRKIKSVFVKVGDEVNTGDVLFVLEEDDSEELKNAQDNLLQLEASYEKSLISISNDNAKENYEIAKARKEYDEAAAVYKLYSDKDASVIIREENEAKVKLNKLRNEYEDAERQWETAKDESDYLDAVEDVEEYKSDLKSLENERDSYKDELSDLRGDKADEDDDIEKSISKKEDELEKAEYTLAKDMEKYGRGYDRIKNLANGNETLMETLAGDEELLQSKLGAGEDAFDIISDYKAIKKDKDKIAELEDELEELRDRKSDSDTSGSIGSTNRRLERVEKDIKEKEAQLKIAEEKLDSFEVVIDALEDKKEKLKKELDAQETAVENIAEAKIAADEMKAKEAVLEDLLFEQSLGSTENVDMQTAKTEIERERERVEELLANADEAEIKSNVSGVVESINVTAGSTIGAEMTMAAINVADRGYTVKISVTNDQAKGVKVGDPAEITSYFWGNEITAVLDKIETDPQNPGRGKLLVFMLTGDVEPGMNINLAIGQKSSGYEALVPNSAVRNDTNGSFVYKVEAKSSPLGNRYVAVRADVNVLASDDNYTAVTGVGTGDVVITTSAKPIEAGMQVRLVDNN